jgi:hypothetical protein
MSKKYEMIGGRIGSLYFTKFIEKFLLDKYSEEEEAKKSHINNNKKENVKEEDDNKY